MDNEDLIGAIRKARLRLHSMSGAWANEVIVSTDELENIVTRTSTINRIRYLVLGGKQPVPEDITKDDVATLMEVDRILIDDGSAYDLADDQRLHDISMWDVSGKPVPSFVAEVDGVKLSYNPEGK